MLMGVEYMLPNDEREQDRLGDYSSVLKCDEFD